MQEPTAPDVPPLPTKSNLIADVLPSGTATDWEVQVLLQILNTS